MREIYKNEWEYPKPTSEVCAETLKEGRLQLLAPWPIAKVTKTSSHSKSSLPSMSTDSKASPHVDLKLLKSIVPSLAYPLPLSKDKVNLTRISRVTSSSFGLASVPWLAMTMARPQRMERDLMLPSIMFWKWRLSHRAGYRHGKMRGPWGCVNTRWKIELSAMLQAEKPQIIMISHDISYMSLVPPSMCCCFCIMKSDSSSEM